MIFNSGGKKKLEVVAPNPSTTIPAPPAGDKNAQVPPTPIPPFFPLSLQP